VTFNLAGRHAIVTGGGRGIGAAVAESLARAGANLTLMGRTASLLEQHGAGIEDSHGVRVTTITLDVTDDAAVERAFAYAQEQLGPAYILVNNAGQAEGAPFTETTRELWDRLLAVNLTAAFVCTKQVVPAMIEAHAGRIVNIASTAGLKGAPRITAYTASKHGLVGFTRSLALELARAGITVNAVCPGYADTEMSQRTVKTISAGTGKTPQEVLTLISKTNAFGRLVRPEEVANAVAWFCSPEAEGVTGQALVIGGET
jgi:NAD(P)-dependent dehydrogenase (short-subunit alcohol dehydrogenase family)